MDPNDIILDKVSKILNMQNYPERLIPAMIMIL